MIDRGPIVPFRLKEFLATGAAARARGSLSSSFAEPTSMQRLSELDPTLMSRLASFTGAYPAAHGAPELREAIGSFLGLAGEEVIVTNGADEAIDLVYRSLLVPGDAVALVDPAYRALRSLAEQQGARVLGVPLDEPSGWTLPPAGQALLLAGSPRVLALNLPHNPTGWMPEAAQLDQLVDDAGRAGATVVFDEIYGGLDHRSGEPFRSLAVRYPQSITIGSLSKGFGLPGLVVGWVASRRREVIERLETLRLHGNSFVSALSEMAALSAVRNAPRILARTLEIARANREALLAFAARRPDLWSVCAPPRGVLAFARWLGSDTTAALSARALDALGLLVVPSALFDFGDRHVRFGYGSSTFAPHLATFERFLR
jgi:aspartate/methionine/tyrosine aminotransferase